MTFRELREPEVLEARFTEIGHENDELTRKWHNIPVPFSKREFVLREIAAMFSLGQKMKIILKAWE